MTNSSLPIEFLEQRAAEQRRQLHNAAQELRTAVRHRVDVKRNAREHFGPAAAIVALIAMSLGYGITGAFVGGRKAARQSQIDAARRLLERPAR